MGKSCLWGEKDGFFLFVLVGEKVDLFLWGCFFSMPETGYPYRSKKTDDICDDVCGEVVIASDRNLWRSIAFSPCEPYNVRLNT